MPGLGKMDAPDKGEITALLARWREGDREAGDALLARVYDELKAIAAREFRRERAGHTLQPTALAHEACVRMLEEGGLDAGDRAHFLALASHVVRRVLVDHSRARDRLKRGGGQVRVELAESALKISGSAPDLIDLDRALTGLADRDEDAARVVELKFFGGLTVHQIAAEMGISVATVSRKWKFAKAWLYGALASPDAGEQV